MNRELKYFYSILVSIFTLLILSACGGDKTNSDRLLPDVEGISFNATAMDILSTETIQFEAEASYTDGSKRIVTNDVTWSVSDKDIATINTEGLLTPKALGGEVNVTTGYAGYYKTGLVTITPLSSVIITAQDENFTTNSTYQLSATGYYGEEENITSDITTKVFWATSDQEIAIVDINGLMYTYSVGSVDINVTLFDINDTLDINITDN